MAELIFLGTLISLLVFSLKLIVKLLQHKRIITELKVLGLVISGYALIWIFFNFSGSYKPVPFGTDICFDDWCATVMAFEKPGYLTIENTALKPEREFVILHIKMSNHARGIAQKPSNPRIHIIDDKGIYYSYSPEGQEALEKLKGRQIPVDTRLELHQSLETLLVFEIPPDLKNPRAIIEEGPIITKLLFQGNKEVFSLK